MIASSLMVPPVQSRNFALMAFNVFLKLFDVFSRVYQIGVY